MVWSPFKGKTSGHLVAKSEGSNNETRQPRQSCNTCGDRCKKCGTECKCKVRRVYVRPPMFNYYTDLMH